MKFVTVSSAILLLSAAGVGNVQADTHDRTLAVVMTNDPNANQVKVYDATTGDLLQTLSTNGKGGAGTTPGACGSSTANCSPPSTTDPTAWQCSVAAERA